MVGYGAIFEIILHVFFVEDAFFAVEKSMVLLLLIRRARMSRKAFAATLTCEVYKHITIHSHETPHPFPRWLVLTHQVRKSPNTQMLNNSPFSFH